MTVIVEIRRASDDAVLASYTAGTFMARSRNSSGGCEVLVNGAWLRSVRNEAGKGSFDAITNPVIRTVWVTP
jgi:hypothetical protein